ncbi:MAG: sulfotransferase domain-containing protein [Gammaproteobacteria bacterium]|jgi:hypothetical protein
MFQSIWKKVSRHAVLGAVFFLPYEKRRKIERWIRGRWESNKIAEADWILASWGKSGRTWLRVMLSRYYQVRFDLPEGMLIGFDNMHKRNPGAPRVFFTHGNYLKDYTGHTEDKRDFYGKKIVLLVRDPRDVAVSQFFQWKYRMRPRKKRLNDYPEHGADISMYDFMMHREQGMPRIVEYFNGWADDIERLPDMLIVRYEDMKARTAETLKRIVEFTGTPGTDDQIQTAVDYAAYENMKKLEEKRAFRLSGGRMKPGDASNPDSFKVRRAKVGGYRDYYTDEQIAAIDGYMTEQLSPRFGYAAEPLSDAATEPAQAAG